MRGVRTSISKERFAQEAITRGLEQASNEDALHRLYDQYCNTGDVKYLNDIILYAERLGMNIACGRLAGTPSYKFNDFEDCLQELSTVLFKLLQEDYRTGKRQQDIVYTIRSIYRKRTIDIVRALCRNKSDSPYVSIDQMNETEDGKTLEVVGAEDDTPWYDPEDLYVRTDLYKKLYHMYLSAMLQYNGEPQKALSLCYARVLFHLELRYDPYEIEYTAAKKFAKDTRSSLSAQEKWISAIQETQKETKASSVKWAREKMNGKTIRALIDESQCLLQKNYDPNLVWGEKVRMFLSKPSPYCGGNLWGTLKYTDEFTESETTDWVQSIHNSVADAVCKQIGENPELEQLVMQYNSPIRQRMILKELRRRKNHASDER